MVQQLLWPEILKEDSMAIRYGLAKIIRGLSVVNHTLLPLEGVMSNGELAEFLLNAGDQGWELCAAYPTASVGMGYMDMEGNLQQYKDASEEIALIFKRSE
jgi:hypothetical protein